MTGCDVFFDSIGDLDFDGTPYRADWPTSTQPGTFPGALRKRSPPAPGRYLADPVRHRPIGERADLRPHDRRRLHGAAAGPGDSIRTGLWCAIPSSAARGSSGNVQTGENFGRDRAGVCHPRAQSAPSPAQSCAIRATAGARRPGHGRARTAMVRSRARSSAVNLGGSHYCELSAPARHGAPSPDAACKRLAVAGRHMIGGHRLGRDRDRGVIPGLHEGVAPSSVRNPTLAPLLGTPPGSPSSPTRPSRCRSATVLGALRAATSAGSERLRGVRARWCGGLAWRTRSPRRSSRRGGA